MLEENPSNYHAAEFLELDLRGADGRRLVFDEIVSSWSLRFVIKSETDEANLAILRRALAHLKPGGVLRIFPVSEIASRLQRYSAILLSSGEISNHTDLESARQELSLGLPHNDSREDPARESFLFVKR
jgi:hypothetical protein